MQITAALHARVIAKLTECIALAEKHYGIKIRMPRVVYNKRGTTAGTANYRTWTIDLNAGLFLRNVEEFLDDTVPHELGHLINDQVYPESHERDNSARLEALLNWRPGMRMPKREKREVHGATWREVCRVIGMKEITRCHQFDTTETKVIKSNGRQIEWKCTCGESLMLTPKKSAKLDEKPGSIWHRGCRGAKLTRVSALPTVDLQKYGAVAHPVLPVTKVQVFKPSGESKIDACKKLYLRYSMCSRSEIIAKFVAEAGCTPAGAGTYYATCKKAYG